LPQSTSRAFLPVLAVLLLGSCGGDEGSDPTPTPTGTLRFRLTHVVSDSTGTPAPLQLGPFQYRNEFGNTFSVDGVRYYLSEIGLRGPGVDVNFDGIRYVDVQSPGSLVFEFPAVPADHYDDIVFTVGLSEAANVSGGLPSPDNDHMAWPASLGGGYHYMQLDGQVLDAQAQPLAFHTNTGRVHPAGGDLQANLVEITLTPHFNVIENRIKDVELLVDIAEWFRGPNAIDLTTHVVDITGDTSMQALLQQNGGDVFSLGVITNVDP
jgi:hypothetical protein